MSELDLPQKLQMRRAFWAMGASSRIDVKLSTLIPRTQSRTAASSEEWTDLDVLGVEYAPLSGLSFAVADCKTIKGRVAERVFWLRGVADLFGATTAYLNRDDTLPAAARQLANKLGIAAMDSTDRRGLLDQLGEGRLPAAGSFLDRETLMKWIELTSSTPGRTEAIQRYRRAYYWLLPRHKNLTQLPAYLTGVAGEFRADQRWSLALLIDLSWLYLLSLLWALDEITRLHLSDPASSLRQAILGGQQEIREKEQLAEQLKQLISYVDPRRSKQLPSVPVEPKYFTELTDLASRLLRRRSQATGALRVLEFVGVETIAGRGASWTEAFPASDPLEAKLASDVARFLCRACGVTTDLLRLFDESVGAIADTKGSTSEQPSEKSSAGETQPALLGLPVEAAPSADP